ncbi:hypothetical protein, partial [Mycobacterium tuberculosis]|uniref:hypothetical protein n=1 Tax=Mycobacterium tuberculosis TaxID=1773 RepID=UPI0034CFCAE2
MTAPSWPPSAQPADASTNTVHTPATRLALRGLNHRTRPKEREREKGGEGAEQKKKRRKQKEKDK